MQKRGFTLIELLVVIAIISMLSALFVPNFMSARERGRDTQRKSDLRQVQTAMELYKSDQSPPSYADALPAPGSCWSSGTNCSGNVYMSKFPSDPLSSDADYAYTFSSASPLTYSLCACLENTADIDGVAGNCDDVDYTCSSGLKYELTQP